MIDTWEDRLLTPEDPQAFAAAVTAGRVELDAAMREIQRRLHRYPGSLRARWLEKILLEKGVLEARIAVRKSPDDTPCPSRVPIPVT